MASCNFNSNSNSNSFLHLLAPSSDALAPSSKRNLIAMASHGLP